MRGSKLAGLVLAFALGGASVAGAQQAPHHKQDGDKAKQEWQGKRAGHGRGVGTLLKGIDLTDAQKEQLKAIHAKRVEERKPDDKRSAEDMKQRREERLNEIRAILSPAQREIFDRNAADFQKRIEQRRKAGEGRGERRPERRS